MKTDKPEFYTEDDGRRHDAPYICDNCDDRLFKTELVEIKDIWERVEPGDMMPAGECPECGCLAFPVTNCMSPLEERLKEAVTLLEDVLEQGEDDDYTVNLRKQIRKFLP